MSTTLPLPTLQQTKIVALVGNPNTGKSTVFNRLTGFRQHVGNYPGVTVERRTGALRGLSDGPPIEIVDLPGTYSLGVNQEDEAIVLDVLMGKQSADPPPDLIVSVLDAANLRRNLFFTTQVLELEKPVVVALNMMDLAESSGIHIDADVLATELGVPVVPLVATKQVGIDKLRHQIVESVDAECSTRCPTFPECVCAELDGLRDSIDREGAGDEGPTSRAEAIQTLLAPGGYHEERVVKRCGRGLAEELHERRARIISAGESVVEVEARVRYAWIDRVIQNVVTRVRPSQTPRSNLVDRYLTHPVIGLAVLLLLMGLCFQSVYAWAQPIMNLVDAVFSRCGGLVSIAVPAGAVRSLLVNGVIAGVGAVLVFLPQIVILFLFLAVLEDCGYMARAAFLLDRWMARIGLNGKSFIPLVSSFACAVPAIMATRTIESRRDRMVTIMIAPLMSCSARLPIYVLLTGAFIPATPLLGGLVNAQTLTLLAMYFIGAAVAIPVALILKATVLKGAPQSFLLELPTYKWPSYRTVFHRAYEQAREFCVSAGTIIFAVAIIVWALGYYPHPSSIATDRAVQRAAAYDAHDAYLQNVALDLDPNWSADSVVDHPGVAAALQAIEVAEASDDAGDAGGEAIASSTGPWGEVAQQIYESRRSLDHTLSDIDRDEAGTYLRQSLLGRMGHWIEPIVMPLGWDWRIGTAVIASFPAREVIVATMGTIYNLGADQDENSTGLRDRLRDATWPDGRAIFTVPVALSVMVFFALCCQCGATLAIIKRETRSWSWPVFTFVYMTALAYGAAAVTYHVAAYVV